MLSFAVVDYCMLSCPCYVLVAVDRMKMMRQIMTEMR